MAAKKTPKSAPASSSTTPLAPSSSTTPIPNPAIAALQAPTYPADSFRSLSLAASGIAEASQHSIQHKRTTTPTLDSLTTTTRINRYVPGTLRGDSILPGEGNDMLMIYLDLERAPAMYRKKGGKEGNILPFVRVRHQYPEAHCDKAGVPMKYASPYGSDINLWLPETILAAFEAKTQFPTLIITEGEKKADKACQEGFPAIGISGIHALGYKDSNLPPEFTNLIATCGIKNIIFLLDNDLFTLSPRADKAADHRPKSFFYAVRNFADYFKSVRTYGHDIDCFLAYTSTLQPLKGIDDLLADKPENAKTIAYDLAWLLNHPREHKGALLNLHRLTDMSPAGILEIFHLNTAQDFAEHYQLQLRTLFPDQPFQFSKMKWRFASPQSHEIELAQPLRDDEQFWEMHTQQKSGEIYARFKHVEFQNFLVNRGFGKYRAADAKSWELAQIDGKIITIVTPLDVKEYVTNFVRTMGLPKVLEMIIGSGAQYFNEEKFHYLPTVNLNINRADDTHQNLYFQNSYWAVTAQGPRALQYRQLPGNVLDTSRHPHEAHLIPDFITTSLNPDGTYGIHLSDSATRCTILSFLINTSRHQWQSYTTTTETTLPSGIIERQRTIAEDLRGPHAQDEITHLLAKLSAIGYLLHTYRNPSNTQAIVCMDSRMDEVGASNGRSGKSLMGKILEQMRNVLFVDGKNRKLQDDQFLWEEVTPDTNIIWMDDLSQYFDFESLFAIITGKFTINAKGKSKFKLPADRTPKFLLTTNHALTGDSGSFFDRQTLLGFSSWYSMDYKPQDDFGLQFFDAWDNHPEQWNLFYNLAAFCLQFHLQLVAINGRGIVRADNKNLEKRRLRQTIGEEFLIWADTFYDASPSTDSDAPTNLNREINRKDIVKSYSEHSKLLAALSSKAASKKLRQYCTFAGLIFCPGSPLHEPRKSGGQEFITIASPSFVAPLTPPTTIAPF